MGPSKLCEFSSLIPPTLSREFLVVISLNILSVPVFLFSSEMLIYSQLLFTHVNICVCNFILCPSIWVVPITYIQIHLFFLHLSRFTMSPKASLISSTIYFVLLFPFQNFYFICSYGFHLSVKLPMCSSMLSFSH